MESADFTNTEWDETAIAAKAAEVLAEKADAKVISVSVSDSTATITLRYGYSETAATIYTPSDAAAQWTAHIESTKLGSTTVPGSDMKYSEAPDIQKAMADGYSAIWAAKTETDATKALEDSKAALLKVVQDYIMQSEATGNYPVALRSDHERYLVDAPLRRCLSSYGGFLCHYAGRRAETESGRFGLGTVTVHAFLIE